MYGQCGFDNQVSKGCSKDTILWTACNLNTSQLDLFKEKIIGRWGTTEVVANFHSS